MYKILSRYLSPSMILTILLLCAFQLAWICFNSVPSAVMDLQQKTGFSSLIKLPQRPRSPSQIVALLNGWVFNGHDEDSHSAFKKAEDAARATQAANAAQKERRKQALGIQQKKSKKASTSNPPADSTSHPDKKAKQQQSKPLGSVTPSDFVDIAALSDWYLSIKNLPKLRDTLQKQAEDALSFVKDAQKSREWRRDNIRTYNGSAVELFIRGHCFWPRTKTHALANLVNPLMNALALESFIISSYRKNLLLQCYGARLLRQKFEAALDRLSVSRIMPNKNGSLKATPMFFWPDRLRTSQLSQGITYPFCEPSQYLTDITLQQERKVNALEIETIMLKVAHSPAAWAWNFEKSRPYKKVTASDVFLALMALYRVSGI